MSPVIVPETTTPRQQQHKTQEMENAQQSGSLLATGVHCSWLIIIIEGLEEVS